MKHIITESSVSGSKKLPFPDSCVADAKAPRTSGNLRFRNSQTFNVELTPSTSVAIRYGDQKSAPNRVEPANMVILSPNTLSGQNSCCESGVRLGRPPRCLLPNVHHGAQGENHTTSKYVVQK